MKKIIAEFCQNHNGSFDNLEKMVKQASIAGATHGKIQTIHAKRLNFRPQFENGLSYNDKLVAIKRPFKNEYDRLIKLELSKEDVLNFIKICKDYNLIPLTTCFAREDVNKIRDSGFEIVKIASYDCSSYQMIRELKKNFLELIISTGATFDNEISMTSDILLDFNYSYLHCITIYPTPIKDLNLKRINWLKKFTNKVGFSDHSLVKKDGIFASMAAIYFGADIIERHFTILDENETKDGIVSINYNQLKELVDFSNMNRDDQRSILFQDKEKLELSLGSETRELSDIEILNRNYYRGRFGSHRTKQYDPTNMIMNWEETPLL